jgi:hypothetical protein
MLQRGKKKEKRRCISFSWRSVRDVQSGIVAHELFSRSTQLPRPKQVVLAQAAFPATGSSSRPIQLLPTPSSSPSFKKLSAPQVAPLSLRRLSQWIEVMCTRCMLRYRTPRAAEPGLSAADVLSRSLSAEGNTACSNRGAASSHLPSS